MIAVATFQHLISKKQNKPKNLQHKTNSACKVLVKVLAIIEFMLNN